MNTSTTKTNATVSGLSHTIETNLRAINLGTLKAIASSEDPIHSDAIKGIANTILLLNNSGQLTAEEIYTCSKALGYSKTYGSFMDETASDPQVDLRQMAESVLTALFSFDYSCPMIYGGR